MGGKKGMEHVRQALVSSVVDVCMISFKSDGIGVVIRTYYDAFVLI